MNNFVEVLQVLKTINVFYQDTDSLYIEKKHWDTLNSACYVESNLCQVKNDYNDGGFSLDWF